MEAGEIVIPISTPESITSDRFISMVEEVSSYDQLTIGPADKHKSAISQSVQYGKGCLMVVFRGLDNVEAMPAINKDQLMLEEV